MKRTEINDIYLSSSAYEGKTITVAGWVKTARESKNIGFVEINDGSCFLNLQVVLLPELIDAFKALSNAAVGSAVIFDGVVEMTPGARQPFELKALSGEVHGACQGDYPLQKKRHSLEFLRTVPHLRARTNTFNAVFRLRSKAAYAIHKYFNDNGFIHIHTPIITGSDCEGAGEMFRVTALDVNNPPRLSDGSIDYGKDFFSRESNLTVSGQLDAEGLALGLGKVYTFGPTFRAENSNTPRHAAEFWMIEPEMAFCDLEGDMDVAEDMIKSVIEQLQNTCADELNFFNRLYDNGLLERLEALRQAEFERIDYGQAIEILERNNQGFDFKVSWGCDLQTEHERYLTEQVFNKPVFVKNYPKGIKAFYMRLNDDAKTVAAVDMLVPGVGELIGGSQREERYDMLYKRIVELGLSPEDYSWYLDLRRFGTAVHSGFGLGFERLIMYLSGLSNIRDSIPYPRTAGGF